MISKQLKESLVKDRVISVTVRTSRSGIEQRADATKTVSKHLQGFHKMKTQFVNSKEITRAHHPAALTEALLSAGLLRPGRSEQFLVEADKNADEYLRGRWLEELAALAMEEAGFEEWHCGVELEWSHDDVVATNEIDVLARIAETPVFVSCKALAPDLSRISSPSSKLRTHVQETMEWNSFFANGEGKSVLMITTDLIDEDDDHRKRRPQIQAKADALGIEIISGDHFEWNELVDAFKRIKAELMPRTIADVPLEATRTHFLYPLILNTSDPDCGSVAQSLQNTFNQRVEAACAGTSENGPLAAFKLKEHDTEARNYFSSHLRARFAPTISDIRDMKTPTLRTLERNVENVALKLEFMGVGPNQNQTRSELRADISAVRLHSLSDDCLFLEMETRLVPPEAVRPDEEERSQQTPVVRFADLLRFNESMRFAFSSLIAHPSELDGPRFPLICLEADGVQIAGYRRGVGDIATASYSDENPPKVLPSGEAEKDPFSSLFIEMLVHDNLFGNGGAFCGVSRQDLFNLTDPSRDFSQQAILSAFDDRMRVFTSAICEKGADNEAITDIDAGLAALREVEADCDWPYQEAFSKEELDNGRSLRWSHRGTHYAASDHSFVALMSGKMAITQQIQDRDMPNIYKQMALVNWTQMALLNHFEQRIFNVYEQADADDVLLRQNYQEVSKDFSRFSNLFWYNQLSNKTQGQELFTLMRQQTTADTVYTSVRNDLERTEQQLMARADENLQNLLAMFAVASVGMAILTLMLDLKEKAQKGWDQMATCPVVSYARHIIDSYLGGSELVWYVLLVLLLIFFWIWMRPLSGSRVHRGRLARRLRRLYRKSK